MGGTRMHEWTRHNWFAFWCCALSACVLAGMAIDAVRLDPLPKARPVTVGVDIPVAEDEQDQPANSAKLLAAVDQDPFHPDRRRPAGRYVFPGERTVSAPSNAHLPTFRVFGLAIRAEGAGLAMIQADGRPVRVLHVGDSYAGFSLNEVRPTAAVLTGQDTTLVLPLRPPWAEAFGRAHDRP